MSRLVSSRAGLLSQQISNGRYFFLQLAPPRGARLVPVFGGRETCNVDYVVRRSWFAYHGIEYVAEGAGMVRLDGRETALAPGSVFAYAPKTDCEIRTDPARPMVKYFVCLAGTALPARSGPVAEGTFYRCKALIDAQAEDLATLEEIAARMKIEPSSICRLFRRFLGTSPHRYLLRRKMTIAAEFLIETGGYVKEAAQRVGFVDPYHFSRCFKAVHGISPNQLRGNRRHRTAPESGQPAG